MDKNEEEPRLVINESVGSVKDNTSEKTKAKSRGKKRKRLNSESSSEYEEVLPENYLEVERNLHASAIKNNLDETSVRKIIKKVVTNDRVLALVKMREEEDSGPEENSLRPKLTRAKVKELMKVSPKTTAWNLEKLELTPIKHIPVKTRPEVKALIAQELPEDEDDEEYEPTHDDVPSDDDQGLESCSDLDSQPRTPATPRSVNSVSPRVVKDGPFKVPQDVSTPTRRKLDLEEEATIALRTRSKLSLSSTSIEHIESTFVPPDDIPMPAVDDLWNQFLNECLNPASTSKNEDDDETDPEYNVAADPDAHDEDEEALGNTIIKISKKELNDLVTELFNIMPEPAADVELIADNLTNSVLTDNSQTEVSGHWEGKQEPVSDDDSSNKRKFSDRITFEKKNYLSVSLGKSEPTDPEERVSETPTRETKDANKENNKQPVKTRVICIDATKNNPPVVNVAVEEQVNKTGMESAPPLLQLHLQPVVHNEFVHVQVHQASCVLPDQIQILQQQLRQHVQLATSNYLHLYVHPVHWQYAGKYKEYLVTFSKLVEMNPKSVANVCNLKPAIDLVTTWEKIMAEDTPANTAMIEFIQKETDRNMRRVHNKNLYVGEFHETYKKVVANSPVFLYPYLLPSMPFRGDTPRRFCYLHSEDELIALGLQQFWEYVTNNPSIYKPRPVAHPHHRWGLTVTLQLVVKHMFPWMSIKVLQNHIQNARKNKDKENPIYQYFLTRTVTPVKHKLLQFNPKLTLYEQPEHEMPRIWVRYLAKTSKRFKNYLHKRTNTTGRAPDGVAIELGQAVAEPTKVPLPIDFNKQIVCPETVEQPNLQHTDKFDVQITSNQQQSPIVTNFYKFVETSTGAYLLPLTTSVTIVNSNTGPITTPAEINSNISRNDLPETSKSRQKLKEITTNSEHCSCCILLRKICKERQTMITDYFGTKKREMACGCRGKRYPRVSNRLRLLVNNFKTNYTCARQLLQYKLKLHKRTKDTRLNDTNSNNINSDSELEDITFVTNFYMNLLTKTNKPNQGFKRKKLHSLLTKFNPYDDDPLNLVSKLDEALGNELVDLYKDFLGFLTPEQADKLDAFKDYFTRTCITDLVKKVEEQVSNGEKKRKILEELHKVFSRNLSTACEICTGILSTLDGYPSLAQYVHSLFPHRKRQGIVQKVVPSEIEEQLQEVSQPAEKLPEETAVDEESAMIEDTTVNYEADQSMSEDEGNVGSKSDSESEIHHDGDPSIKIENITTESITETPRSPTTDYITQTMVSPSTQCTTQTPTSESVSLVITVSKTEMQDFSECSNTSMKFMFEDEIVKLECPEWKRDEDKLILEVLKEHLTPEEREDKTILDVIREKNIIGMLSESLTHKTKQDIRTRVMYLLQIC